MDPRVQQIIDYLTTPPAERPLNLTVEQRRQNWAEIAAVLNEGAPDRPFVAARALREDGGGQLSVDVYPPSGPGPHPVVLYLHGGGWIMGSPATHRKLTLRFAEAGFLCISVDYALAPERPFPAGLDDCLAAARWAVAHAPEFGGDPERMAIAGDSAGGNLAAAALAAQLAAGGAPFKAALLIYGVFDFAALLGDDPARAASLKQTLDWYLGAAGEALLHDPRVSPLYSPHLNRFPPTQLLVGTRDALVDQSRAFAGALERAGVPADLRIYEGMPHAFLQIEDLPACLEAQAAMWSFLRRQLAAPQPSRA